MSLKAQTRAKINIKQFHSIDSCNITQGTRKSVIRRQPRQHKLEYTAEKLTAQIQIPTKYEDRLEMNISSEPLTRIAHENCTETCSYINMTFCLLIFLAAFVVHVPQSLTPLGHKDIYIYSNTPKVRWVVPYRFCRKFHRLSNSAKILKIG